MTGLPIKMGTGAFSPSENSMDKEIDSFEQAEAIAS